MSFWATETELEADLHRSITQKHAASQQGAGLFSNHTEQYKKVTVAHLCCCHGVKIRLPWNPFEQGVASSNNNVT